MQQCFVGGLHWIGGKDAASCRKEQRYEGERAVRYGKVQVQKP